MSVINSAAIRISYVRVVDLYYNVSTTVSPISIPTRKSAGVDDSRTDTSETAIEHSKSFFGENYREVPGR